MSAARRVMRLLRLGWVFRRSPMPESAEAGFPGIGADVTGLRYSRWRTTWMSATPGHMTG